MQKSPTQLVLNLQLRDDARFENFYVGDNQQLYVMLQDFIVNNSEPLIYFWGESGSGRSHLLQAACHQAQQTGLGVIYLPLALKAQISPQILDNLESVDLICIDDINLISGDTVWEQAIFHKYNQVREHGARMLIAANAAPANLSLYLGDLASRLAHGIVYQLRTLSDEQKIAALKMRAKMRGFVLTLDVVTFLINHYSRDTNALFNILERLDRASLAAKRKITIPFIKQILTV